MRHLVTIAALALVSIGAAGCFSVDRPVCSYVCADVDPKCPDDYECRSDGYCHLVGSTASCAFSDAAVPIDMSVSGPADMTSPTSTSD